MSVCSEDENKNLGVVYLVDKAVLLCDTSAPPLALPAFQLLWVTCAGGGMVAQFEQQLSHLLEGRRLIPAQKRDMRFRLFGVNDAEHCSECVEPVHHLPLVVEAVHLSFLGLGLRPVEHGEIILFGHSRGVVNQLFGQPVNVSVDLFEHRLVLGHYAEVAVEFRIHPRNVCCICCFHNQSFFLITCRREFYCAEKQIVFYCPG